MAGRTMMLGVVVLMAGWDEHYDCNDLMTRGDKRRTSGEDFKGR